MAFQKRGSEKRAVHKRVFVPPFVKFRVTRTVRRRWYRLCQPISILATHRHVYTIPRERFNTGEHNILSESHRLLQISSVSVCLSKCLSVFFSSRAADLNDDFCGSRAPRKTR